MRTRGGRLQRGRGGTEAFAQEIEFGGKLLNNSARDLCAGAASIRSARMPSMLNPNSRAE